MINYCWLLIMITKTTKIKFGTIRDFLYWDLHNFPYIILSGKFLASFRVYENDHCIRARGTTSDLFRICCISEPKWVVSWGTRMFTKMGHPMRDEDVHPHGIKRHCICSEPKWVVPWGTRMFTHMGSRDTANRNGLSHEGRGCSPTWDQETLHLQRSTWSRNNFNSSLLNGCIVSRMFTMLLQSSSGEGPSWSTPYKYINFHCLDQEGALLQGSQTPSEILSIHINIHPSIAFQFADYELMIQQYDFLGLYPAYPA